MNDNCPVDCPHCSEERFEEAEQRAIMRQEREENDANFADQEPE